MSLRQASAAIAFFKDEKDWVLLVDAHRAIIAASRKTDNPENWADRFASAKQEVIEAFDAGRPTDPALENCMNIINELHDLLTTKRP